ncbi:MAG: rhodanese-like domain-containing protein [Candidatus Saccharibacteria bacterium]|nr:rhodanese-like domain-containing protein [Candidatus Saccharibacteria bacterium]
MMKKIILYYKFCSIDQPKVIQLWQNELCQRLNLRGRIIVSSIGINGTLGGNLSNLKAYKKAMKALDIFSDIEYKLTDGSEFDFPKLSVKVRPEPVTLEAIKEFNAFNSSKGLSPKQWHEYLTEHPQTLVLDARNYYESEIGSFKVDNLIKPKIKTFKDIKPIVAKLPKDQPILTYCTGDVRCEYLSAYMQSEGFKTVHHLRGGIIKYGQTYGDGGLWQGKCYVFDRRMQLGFSKKAQDIAQCLVCQNKTSDQVNCDDCNRQLVVCLNCQKQPYYHCQNPTVSSRTRK